MYLLANAAVKDFESWKSSFHSNESYRAEHGERGYQVFQSADDPNEAVVLFEWSDDEDPRAFFGSEEMRERMTEAGLVAPPEMTVLELVEEKSARQPSA
ncbi:putative quinol monooxygenase [Haloglomus salinum]|jgi:quinol monooxygenase YgiN|uniref:putative quinol monooxygenase n=1 Tax=Haloglomus salinum TaxID=2962673 RepID=UPI0020CA2454|nr:antibiotic biosynthesis monooxygenase [Haloglomus salinum]